MLSNLFLSWLNLWRAQKNVCVTFGFRRHILLFLIYWLWDCSSFVTHLMPLSHLINSASSAPHALNSGSHSCTSRLDCIRSPPQWSSHPYQFICSFTKLSQMWVNQYLQVQSHEWHETALKCRVLGLWGKDWSKIRLASFRKSYSSETLN